MSPAETKMDPVLKAKWVEALRSGTFKQGTGCLRRGDQYCCLGVLAKIAGLQFEDQADANSIVADGKIVGYRPLDAIIGDSDAFTELWWRNDGLQGRAKHSFPQIADYIEREL